MHEATLNTLNDVPAGTILTKTGEPCPSVGVCSSRLWESSDDGGGRRFYVCLTCGAIDVRDSPFRHVK